MMVTLPSSDIATIARALLGTPNDRLSTRAQLRFGKNGSLAVDIEGPKAGAWFDHEHGNGGGILDLIRECTGRTNGAAITWMRELGVSVPDTKDKRRAPARRIVATYDYTDSVGALLYQVLRYEPKDFRQRRPDGKGGWLWSTKGLRFVPYRLPELLADAGKRTVFIPEGEKDVDNLRRLGVAATCNPGGSKKWPPHFGEFFADADVVILPDNDPSGQEHATQVAANVVRFARSVRVLNLPGLPNKGDVSDWIQSGGTAEQLARLAEATSSVETRTADEGSATLLPRPDVFRLLDLDALDSLVPPDWLLSGYLPENSLGLMYGAPRSFKSFVALSWGLSIAYGIPWFGRPVRQGVVVYIAAEGAAGQRKRVAAWRVDNGVEDIQAPFYLLPRAVNITDPGGEDVQVLLCTLEDVRRRTGLPVSLVILDTLHRCMAGADEDSAGDMGKAVASMDLIRERTGAAVLALHHTGKDKDRGPRGSSALLGDVDVAVECARDTDTMLARLATTKQKDHEEADPLTLKAIPVEVADGVTGELGASLVLTLVDERTGGQLRTSPKGNARFALDALHDVLARVGKSAPGELSDRAPAGVIVTTTGEWREAFVARRVGDEKPETTRRTFHRAAQWLQDQGHVAKWGEYVWSSREDDQ